MRFLHRQQQCALAVVQRQAVDFLSAVADTRDLVERDRGAGIRSAIGPHFSCNDDVAEVLGALDTGIDFYNTLLCQRADGTNRQILVFTAHGIDNLLGRYTERLHCLRVQIQIDLPAGAADQRHCTCTAHVFKALFQNLIRPIRQLYRRHRRRSACRHYRDRPNRSACRVKAQYAWLFDFRPEKRPDNAKLFTHVFSGFSPVNVQLEFNDDDCLAFVAARCQGAYACDGVNAFFDFFCDFTLNNFWRCARIFCGDYHHWQIDVGELVDLHPLVRKQAQHDDGQHHHGGEHRVF